MKKIILTYIALFCLFFLSAGCEKSKVVEVPLQFEEDVVIQGQLVADTLFQGVRITRTLPVNETFNISKAQITDAFVYLRINGVKIVPLHFTSDSIYMPLSYLYVNRGDNYELFGEAEGKKFYSQTIIPKTPEVLSSDYNKDNKYMEATITVNSGEVYGALWNIGRSNQLCAKDFYSIVLPDNGMSNLTIHSIELPEQYQSYFYEGRRFIWIYAFDKQYKAFFNSKGNNQPIENYFVQGGGSIAWNVYGDHVIGLFIGLAKSNL